MIDKSELDHLHTLLETSEMLHDLGQEFFQLRNAVIDDIKGMQNGIVKRAQPKPAPRAIPHASSDDDVGRR